VDRPPRALLALAPSGVRVPAWEGRHVAATGSAQPLFRLEAPLSGAPAILYEVRVGLLQRLLDGLSGRSGEHARETAGASFLLETRHGAFLIDASGAEIEGAPRLRRRVRLLEDPALDQRLRALCARLRRGRPGRTLLLEERRLSGGDLVLVQGTVTYEPDPRGDTSTYRAPPVLPCLLATTIEVLGATGRTRRSQATR
jgi:hypothetical protein